MSYPASSSVTAGTATLASQYNLLRQDALYLGQSAADAAALGAVLENYEGRLSLQKLNTAQVRVPASASEPVGLVVDGNLVQTTANVDLAVGDIPVGGAQWWYVFANRAVASTTFTLSVNPSPTENASQRRIGRFYFDGTKIIKDSVHTERSRMIAANLGYLEKQPADGRLTLSTGVPVPTADIGSAATLYYSPYVGDRIGLYVPTFGWRVYPFAELNLDISGLAADTNFDIFMYDDEGTLKLSALAWSNNTLRATALARQDGVLVKAGAPTYRYLGTIRTLAGGGAAADSATQRLVWNMYHRKVRKIYKPETTASWTYATAAWRPWNNDTANRIEMVVGLDEDPVYLEFFCRFYNSAAGGAQLGIGVDVTNASHADLWQYLSLDMVVLWCKFCSHVSLGYHFLQLVEFSDAVGTTTFYGYAAGIEKYGGLGWLIN